MKEEEHVRVTRDGAVLVVRFVNEKSRNSMTAELRSQLADAMRLATQDEEVRAVYITGSGTAFSAGGDLHMLKNQTGPWAVHRRFRDLGAWYLPFLQMEKPVIVGVNGHAIGGGLGLALSGDLIIAAESARFGAGFFRLGVIPDVCTMHILPRLIGMARAKRFLFCNETLTGREAFDIGLAARVVPDDQLDTECMKQAHQFAEGPSHVMGLAKLLMSRSFETGLNDMFLIEGLGQALAQSSDEFHEGLNSMLERRKVDFVNAGRPKPPKSEPGKQD
jgi:2-(1,2-epoxy-1,2-dihydrophenyl)acetyl-CoA isomerase